MQFSKALHQAPVRPCSSSFDTEIPKEVVQTVTNPSDPRLLSILLADRVTSGSCSKKPDKKPKTRPLGASWSHA